MKQIQTTEELQAQLSKLIVECDSATKELSSAIATLTLLHNVSTALTEWQKRLQSA